jgi:membrane protease YdiL (CAAX protease family)
MTRDLNRQEALLAAFFSVTVLALLNHFYTALLYRLHPAWFWASDVLQFVALPAVGCLILRQAGIGLVDCGLGRDRYRADSGSWGFVVFMALALMAVTWPVFRITHHYLWQYTEPFSIQQVLPTSPGPKLLVALYMSATAALVEEVAYRALPWLYLSAVLPQRWRRSAYVVGTTLVFALVHSEQGPGGVIAAGWFGFVAAWMYSRQRMLWPLVAGHFLIDLLVFGPW